jgi:hypothetical protein
MSAFVWAEETLSSGVVRGYDAPTGILRQVPTSAPGSGRGSGTGSPRRGWISTPSWWRLPSGATATSPTRGTARRVRPPGLRACRLRRDVLRHGRDVDNPRESWRGQDLARSFDSPRPPGEGARHRPGRVSPQPGRRRRPSSAALSASGGRDGPQATRRTGREGFAGNGGICCQSRQCRHAW